MKGRSPDQLGTSNAAMSKDPTKEEKVSRYLKDGIVIYHSETLHVSNLLKFAHSLLIAPKREDQWLFMENGRRSQVFLYWTLLQKVLHPIRTNQDAAHPRQSCVKKSEENSTESIALH